MSSTQFHIYYSKVQEMLQAIIANKDIWIVDYHQMTPNLQKSSSKPIDECKFGHDCISANNQLTLLGQIIKEQATIFIKC